MALTVYPADYNDLLVDYCIVKITAVVRVHETNQFWSEEDDFTLTKPTLKVEAVGTLQVSLKKNYIHRPDIWVGSGFCSSVL